MGLVRFTVDEPVFKTDPMFIIGCSHAQLDRYLRKRFNCDAGTDEGQCGQMFTFNDIPLRVVWARDYPANADTLSVLMHEIFHLVTRICMDKGIPIKAQITEGFGDETAAYLMDFFTREAVGRLVAFA